MSWKPAVAALVPTSPASWLMAPPNPAEDRLNSFRKGAGATPERNATSIAPATLRWFPVAPVGRNGEIALGASSR